MTIQRLDHLTIRTRDVARSVQFYRRVLGLTPGYRPAFPGFPGAWLYCDARPVVHLLLDERSVQASGCVDHIAFAGADLPGFRKKLAELGIAYREIPPAGDVVRHQVFVEDPNGVAVEVNFD